MFVAQDVLGKCMTVQYESIVLCALANLSQGIMPDDLKQG